MTAQIGSIYNYNDEPCNVVAENGYVNFNPREYGLNPTPRSTACWSGYWCEYDIKEDGLYLKKLFIHCADDNYPEINGISAKKSVEKIVLFEGTPEEKVIIRETHLGYYMYENLNLKMHFSGTIKILVGKNFLDKYYIHMGYQMYYAYEKLLEFVLTDGKLIEIIDHSHIAKKARDDLDRHPEKMKEIKHNPFKFVSTMFSLSYDDKVWWLK